MEIKVLVWEQITQRVEILVDVSDPDDPGAVEEAVHEAAMKTPRCDWEIVSSEGVNFEPLE